MYLHSLLAFIIRKSTAFILYGSREKELSVPDVDGWLKGSDTTLVEAAVLYRGFFGADPPSP